MNVLVLNWLDRENPGAGGAEIHLHETFGRLASAGWAVTVVSSGWPGAASRTELDGLDIHRVGGRFSYPLRVAAHVHDEFDGRRFDVVVEDLNKVPLLSPTWAPAPVLLLVHHLFGNTVFQEATLPLALATWTLERPLPSVYRAVPVIAVSESTRVDLIERGLDRRTIEVIENGIDLDRFPFGPPEGRFPEPTILYLGRLKRYKRVDLVIRAVALLRDRGHPVRLLIAGKGDHREALEKEAAHRGLDADAVQFLGFVSEERKVELLRRAWVHTLTSPKEGWGIANLEAAACGTPTVASDSPGLRDSVLHDRTGLLVPHGNVSALAEALERLLQNRPLRGRMGTEGRAFAEQHGWDRAAGRFGRSVERVVASSRRGGYLPIRRGF